MVLKHTVLRNEKAGCIIQIFPLIKSMHMIILMTHKAYYFTYERLAADLTLSHYSTNRNLHPDFIIMRGGKGV